MSTPQLHASTMSAASGPGRCGVNKGLQHLDHPFQLAGSHVLKSYSSVNTLQKSFDFTCSVIKNEEDPDPDNESE